MATQEELSSKLRAKTPRSPGSGWKRLALIAILPGAVLMLLCMIPILAALAPAGPIDRRPVLLAALQSPTPTLGRIDTATATSTPPEPTDTLTPRQRMTPSATPTPTLTPTPLPTPDAEERERYVPILMYHYISVPPPDADIYRLDLSVTPDNFRSQMDWLKRNGYETITLYDLIYWLNIGWPPLPEKPVILTFDDGYIDNYKNAFPILKEYGFTGTFFILTDVTDRRQAGYMNWRMLQEMSKAGMNIEVHGREHVEMVNRDHAWLVFHLLGPAQTIEANLGYRPRFLSYPAGLYDEAVIAAAQEQGYWGAVTTVGGALQSKAAPFEMRRLRVRGDWTLETFAEFVEEFTVTN